MTMPNSGNLGLPLVLLAFGDDGLAKGVAFYFVIAIVQYVLMPIVVAGTIFLLASMPSAVVTHVIAARFDQEPQKVAGLVVVSSLLTLICLPLLLWTALWMAGV